MASTEDTIRPDFRPDFLGQSQDTDKNAKREAAAEGLKGAENAALGGATSGLAGRAAGGLEGGGAGGPEGGGAGGPTSLTGGATGAKSLGPAGMKQKKNALAKMKKAAPAAILGVFLLIFGVIAATVAVPMLIIGAIDYNLQNTEGFAATVEVILEQAIYIIREMMIGGEVPNEFANQLAEKGINLGQVTASGDFVRTNKYLANLDGVEVATLGSGFTRTGEEGELSILFEGELIAAADFPEKVNENPRLYLAFAEGADVPAKFYYGDAVNEVYDELKISRNNFKDWQPSGSAEQDAENFQRIISQMLDSNATIETNGHNVARLPDLNGNIDDVASSGDYNKTYSSASNMSGREIIDEMRNKMRDNDTHNTAKDRTGQVAQLLSLAVSSAEPYQAANAFIAIEEPIQRARIDGDGPINELMNMISTGNEVEYTDVGNKTTKTADVSILDTGNFQGAVSDSGFDADEALSFSRDRVLLVTDTGNSRISNKSFQSTKNNPSHQPALASNGHPKSNMTQRFKCALKIFRNDKGEETGQQTEDTAGCQRAEETVYNAANSIDQVLSDENSKLFQSIVGGNRIVEGGSYIMNLINQRTLGAMPASETYVIAYNDKVNTLLARKDAAEAAVKSPFDISSPNTFLGKIVHNLGVAAIKNSSLLTRGGSLVGATATVSGLAMNSAEKLLGVASADGAEEFYEVIGNGNSSNNGGNCPTVDEVNAACTLYGSSHNVMDTSRMENTLDDWKNELGNNLESSGEIADKSDLAGFVTMGMYRDATVGLDSGEICERWQNNQKGFLNGLKKVWDGVKRFVSEILPNGGALYNACDTVYGDSKGKYVPNGAAYTFGSGHQVDDLGKFSGYALYSTTRSLIENTTSPATAYMNLYYETYPLDNSDSGWLARISGMSKGEAEMVLAYVDYLGEIANYNPAERYVFGSTVEISVPESFAKKTMRENFDKTALMALVAREGDYRKVRDAGTVL